MMRRIILPALVCSLVVPSLALAWQPYPPYAPPVPEPFAYPDYHPIVPPMPATPWSREGDDWTSMPERPAWPRLTLNRRTTQDAYLIEINLENIAPDQVEIRPAGRGLVITHQATIRHQQSDALPSGEGYQNRYSLTRDTSVRRVGLPPDADLANMTREVKDGQILIRVPRTTNPWRGAR
ncbi:Hsp20/alpha crystallin family protein [Caldichromatium japonicum]|uniref:Hsp20/alpha crystallin family protein n=1 Tax=Caldichromatium japonicum TaxID=2699430 RepID=A0A6G7VBV3_9GAMM|nr:Hsp20/alpha crystallin family protein [Caldichromatium japonicum]QIK37539.1 Hsp20/alpha crystallin family protein [Caldichromatium japonicum]